MHVGEEEEHEVDVFGRVEAEARGHHVAAHRRFLPHFHGDQALERDADQEFVRVHRLAGVHAPHVFSVPL